jgi:hypothetical protein
MRRLVRDDTCENGKAFEKVLAAIKPRPSSVIPATE